MFDHQMLRELDAREQDYEVQVAYRSRLHRWQRNEWSSTARAISQRYANIDHEGKINPRVMGHADKNIIATWYRMHVASPHSSRVGATGQSIMSMRPCAGDQCDR